MRNTLKLTPNHRLAAYVENALPLTVWLEQCYVSLSAHYPERFPKLLLLEEEMIIWERIILNSPMGQTLLRVSETAHLAREAWRLCTLWEVSDFANDFLSEEHQAFLNWQATYQALCSKNHWVDEAAALSFIKRAHEERLMTIPNSIQLIGFAELPPAWQTFFQVLSDTGYEIRHTSLLTQTESSYLLRTENEEEELYYASEMAKKWLEENPSARIGIVIQDLEQRRSQVLRIFKETLSAEVFNIAAPLPLFSYPLIESAFLALKICHGKLSIEKISKFLNSAFFTAGQTEASERAMLDIALRACGEPTFSWNRLLSTLEYESKGKSLAIFKILSVLKDSREKLAGKHKTPYWQERILELLETVGWPGESILESQEQPMKQCFSDLILDYTKLDGVLGEHTFSEALHHLQTLALRKPFLPKSPDAKIHVLGMLEALELPFDYLWVVGLTSESWPLEPAPNPLIPQSIQRAKHLPRSSALRELKVAKRMTESLSKGGKEVIFSYPAWIEEHPMTISPLLQNLQEISPEDKGLSKPKSQLQKMAAFQGLRSNRNEPAPRLQSHEKRFGGAKLVKLQSHCPFKAFAEIRLKALPMPTLQLGLVPSERGEIIHQVLYLFWKELKTHSVLKTLALSELHSKVTGITEEVLETWRRLRPATLQPHYLALEKQRILKVVLSYLLLEKSRPSFTVVGLELERVVVIQGIELKLRIDRIDKLEDDSELLLDYKTGITALRDWFGERPRDPQLPLYSVTHDKEPSGVAFGILRPEGAMYQGVTKENDLLPRVKTLDKLRVVEKETSYAAQNLSWQKMIESLVKEFQEGVATVAPLEGENTCRLCQLKPLCRIKHSL
jgi:ATP-dependent helicase/nuclease subunit B